MKQYGIPKPDYPFKHTQVHQQHQQHQTNSNLQKRTSLPTSHAYPKAHEPVKPANSLTNSSAPNTFFPQAPQAPFYTPQAPSYQQPISNPPLYQSNAPTYQPAATQSLYQPPVITQAPTNAPPPSIYQPSEAAAATYNTASNAPPRVTSYQDTKPEIAWNDPPVVTPKTKPPQVPKEAPLPPNMTFYQPTMAPTSPPSFPNGYGFAAAAPIPTASTVAYNNQAPVAAAPFFNPVNAAAPSVAVQSVVERSVTPQIVEKVQKAPIPDEHLVIQMVFDTLVRKCAELASNPAVKRKVDDASKKLEVLYDKLRDQTVRKNFLKKNVFLLVKMNN